MPDNKASSTFRILGRIIRYPPIGINPQGPLPFTFVLVNPPVQEWVLNGDNDGNFRLSIAGYPFTGVIGGKIAASVNPEDDVAWKLIYQEFQDAYTIVRADDTSMGWSVTSDYLQVELRPIIVLPSEPPKFMETQLFALQEY